MGTHVDLTPREQQLVAALLRGAGNKEIAGLLGLKVQTVKNQLATLYQKTGASTRLELAMFIVTGRLDVGVTPEPAAIGERPSRRDEPYASPR